MAGIFAATITVSSAGTAVQITSTPTPFEWAIFHIAEGNSNDVAIGASDVSMTNGLTLEVVGNNNYEKDSWRIDGKLFTESPPLDLSDFYVDATTNGDKIEVLAKVL